MDFLTFFTPFRRWLRCDVGACGDAEQALASKSELKQLRRKAVWFDAVLDNAPINIYFKAPDGTFSWVNRKFAETFGEPAEKFIGKTATDHLSGAASDLASDHDRRVLATGRAESQEEEHLGRIFHVLKCPVFDADGNIIAIVGFDMDITERKRAEQALRESEQQLRLATDALPALISYVDSQECYRLNNTAYERWFGHPREQLYGQQVKDVLGVAAYDAIKPHIDTALSGETVTYEALLPYKDGGHRYVRASYVPHVAESGQVYGFFALTEDLTEHKRAEDALHQFQKMKAVGHLTGGVAHEFNNMLAVIMGNMELLEELLGDDPESHELIGRTMKVSERGARLTSQLLSFARNQPLCPQLTDLDLLVGDMSELLESALGETIQVNMQLAANLGKIDIDPAQIESALLALAVNAHEAMPQGGALTIETSTTRLDVDQTSSDLELTPGVYTALAVSDTGVGMPSEAIECAFDPFFTTKGLATHSGLGLSMVHGFVKQSGGFVDVRSEPGEGTTVTLYFPVTEAEEEKEAIAPEAETELATAGELVLVVEDDPDLRDVATSMLTKLGYRVSAVENGHAALSVLDETAELDLLFTDLVLPGGISGSELAEQAQSRRPDLKVLYTTGYEEAALITDDEPELAAAVIRKPYPKAELAQKVRRVLDT